MKEYDLYLDESGTFTEGLDASERPRFPSQLAGVLAPKGAYGEKEAETILRETFAEVGDELPREVHAKDLGKGERFDRVVGALCGALGRRKGLRAVRLENREGLGFGTIEATYVQMVAELCVRLLEQLAKEEPGDIGLNLIGAIYMIEGEHQLPEASYKLRLEEHIAFAAVRRGLARESSRLRLASVRLGSGRIWRELQVCDVLSNASHAGYRKLGAEARDTLKATFAPLDWTLTLRDLDRRVDDLLDEGSIGLVIRALAEQLVGQELSTGARKAAERRMPQVVHALADLDAPARAPQLAIIDAWLEQLNEHRRDPEMGHRAARWLLKRVDAPLREQLGAAQPSLDGFTMSLWRHALTAANHRGALLDAREASAALDALVPSVAGRWELGPLLIDGLIAQAVHLTDCFEYDAAARRAHTVATYYGELSSLLSVALPGVFPETVRSERRGRALGTELQAEMYAGLSDRARFDVARRLNDEATKEFASAADIGRQRQYRAQLETYAGRLAEARSCLAESLGAEPSHQAVGAAIETLPLVPQGFALLHWWRLGAAVLADGTEDDRSELEDALRQTKLHTTAWCDQADLPYPAHGIRRYQAVIAARRGEPKLAQSVLGHLRKLESGASSHPLMTLLVAAAHMEVAGLTWRGDQAGARRLLTMNDPNRKGAKETLDAAGSRIEGLPALMSWVADARGAVGRVLSGEVAAPDVADELLKQTRRLAY